MKKFILISLTGILTVAFANALGIHKPLLRFVLLSFFCFSSGFILKPIKVKNSAIKLLAFISIYIVFFIVDINKYTYTYDLLYLLTIITFYLLGNSINFENKRKYSFFPLLIAVLILSSEPFFVSEILYSSNIIKEDNKEIPDFTLNDLNGNTITKENFKGKVVFFDFWTTTCGYCIAQFPSIYEIAENFKDNPDVLFYLIDYNGKYDDAEYVKKFVKQRNIRLPVLIDKSSELSKKMNCLAFPHSFILDKNLIIRYHHAGYQKATEKNYIIDVTNRIKELLNE